MFRKNRQDDTKPVPSESTASQPVFPSPPAEPASSGNSQPLSAPSPQGVSPLTPRPRPSLNGTSSTQRPPSSVHHGGLRTLVVGHGISIQGTIQDVERLVIEGTVEANLIQAKEFSIAQGGIFRGTVEVESAEIGGTMDGELTALNSLTLLATGRLVGKASCHRLQVEDGGQITGQLEMITTTSQIKAPSPVPPLSKPKESPKEN